MSCDVGLGVPYNIASYAALLEIYAALGNMTAGTLTMFLGDVHIYENHIEALEEQLTRSTTMFPNPSLSLPAMLSDPEMDFLDKMPLLQPRDIEVYGYESFNAIKMDMAV